MKVETIETTSKNAVHIAAEVYRQAEKRPVLVFMLESDWIALDHIESVDVLDEATAKDIKSFRSKKVVFCYYQRFEEELVEQLAYFWDKLVLGSAVKVKLQRGRNG